MGLDQGWAVYAPRPAGSATYLEARVIDRDGTVTVRSIPLSHGLAEYWDYRWQRYGDTLINSPGNDTRWAPYCPLGRRRRSARPGATRSSSPW